MNSSTGRTLKFHFRDRGSSPTFALIYFKRNVMSHFTERVKERFGFSLKHNHVQQIKKGILKGKFLIEHEVGTRKTYKVEMFGRTMRVVFDHSNDSFVTVLKPTKEGRVKIYKKQFREKNHRVRDKINYDTFDT